MHGILALPGPCKLIGYLILLLWDRRRQSGRKKCDQVRGIYEAVRA